MDQREVQQGTVVTVTQGQHGGCIISFKGNIKIVSVALREL